MFLGVEKATQMKSERCEGLRHAHKNSCCAHGRFGVGACLDFASAQGLLLVPGLSDERLDGDSREPSGLLG